MTDPRDLHQSGLDPGAMAALHALRDAEDMPADARARVWDRLAANLDETEATGPERQGPWTLSRGTWIAVALAAAATLALLLGRAGVLDRTVAQRGDAAARHDVAPTATMGDVLPAERTPALATAPDASPSGHVPQDMPEETAPPAPAPAPAPAPPRPAATREPAPPRPAPPGDGPGSLAAEAESLARAQAALQGGEPDRALTELTAHARQFPRGALREEHDALRAIALCTAGRTREGRGEAQAFLRAHPTSPLAERVRGACPAP